MATSTNTAPRRVLTFPDRVPADWGPAKIHLYYGDTSFPLQDASGEVELRQGDTIGLTITDHAPGQAAGLLGSLPAGAFRRIDIDSGTVASADLAAINAAYIRSVTLGVEAPNRGTPGTPADMLETGVDLSPLERLTSFTAHDVLLEDRHIASLPSPRTIYDLHLRGTTVGAGSLRRFSLLRSLHLEGESHGTNLGFLDAIPGLASFDIRFSRITADALAVVSRHPSLWALGVGYNDGIGSDLSRLTGPESLRYLDLSGTSLDTEGLRTLPITAQLLVLSLQTTRVTDDFVDVVRSARNLQQLRIGGTAITDRGLALIVEAFPRLKSLDVRATSVTAEGMRRCAELPRLRVLGATGSVLSGELADDLKEGTDIQELHICEPGSIDEGATEAIDIIGAARWVGIPG